MAYKVERIDLSETKKLLVQAITNTEFLKQIYVFADPHMLPDTYSKLILQWCFEFYEQFREAPNATIQTIYEKKANYVLKESDAEMIENILDSISNDYVIKGNVEYYVEQAELFFNKLAIKNLQDNIGKLADRGKIEDAVNLISKFKKVERLVPQGVDLLDNDDAIEEAFSEKEDKLFQLPGDLGNLLGSFNRGDLSAVMSPQKRGKTWAMMEIASHAMQSGKKVWFISLEMTRNQIIRRMWQQWTDSVLEEQEVTIPFFDRDGNIRTKTEKRKPMEVKEMTKLRSKFRLAMKQSQFSVYSYPKHTFKVSDLKTLLENSMMYKGEIPDMIVIDYASIMCPERHGEKRFELDQIWADLSAIAVEFNIHVLSASQTGRATLSRDVQQGDTSEAQSITSHVALMFALNQDENDKAQSCIRYSCMFARHKGFLTTDQVVVLQNLACGKAMMDNLYEKYVPNLKSKDRKNKED